MIEAVVDFFTHPIQTVLSAKMASFSAVDEVLPGADGDLRLDTEYVWYWEEEPQRLASHKYWGWSSLKILSLHAIDLSWLLTRIILKQYHAASKPRIFHTDKLNNFVAYPPQVSALIEQHYQTALLEGGFSNFKSAPIEVTYKVDAQHSVSSPNKACNFSIMAISVSLLLLHICAL